jgi:hypothetical protein
MTTSKSTHRKRKRCQENNDPHQTTARIPTSKNAEENNIQGKNDTSSFQNRNDMQKQTINKRFPEWHTE